VTAKYSYYSLPWVLGSLWRHISVISYFGSSWRQAGRVTFRLLHPEESFSLSTWLGEWLNPTTGLDAVCEGNTFTSPGTKLRFLGRPVLYLDIIQTEAPGTDLPAWLKIWSMFAFILWWLQLRRLLSRYGHEEGTQFWLSKSLLMYWRSLLPTFVGSV